MTLVRLLHHLLRLAGHRKCEFSWLIETDSFTLCWPVWKPRAHGVSIVVLIVDLLHLLYSSLLFFFNSWVAQLKLDNAYHLPFVKVHFARPCGCGPNGCDPNEMDKGRTSDGHV